MQSRNVQSNSGKITWLIAALSFCFFLTAYTARRTYNENDKLRYWAGRLQTELQSKERLVDGFLKPGKPWAELKTLKDSTETALAYTRTLTRENVILLLYKRGQLIYWSANQVIPPDISAFRNKRQFYPYTNGYYEAIRKTDADFTAIFFIPIKAGYVVRNTYLPGEIVANLPGSGLIDIAEQKSRFHLPIYTSDNSFLFDVKLADELKGGFFSRLEMICYFTGLLLLCAAVHIVCKKAAQKGHIGWATLSLFLFICALRLVNIALGIPDLSVDFDLFKAYIYADSAYAVFSLGDFMLNILLLAWLASFIYSFRFDLIRRQFSNARKTIILIFCVLVVMTVGAFFSSLFHSLIINSRISFNVNNVFDLSGYSIIGALALC
ncbi:MAG: hypothetical protein INR69_23215, partial [Mucilaginibacter polytrichastri]|nr:hypothetical protein [Mucilaginibacter polytrichastri]